MSVAPAFSRWEWTLAIRYLGARRRHGGVAVISALSFIGITLAVAVLVATMSVMNGFRAEFQERFLGFNGHAFVGGPLLYGPDPQALARLRAVPGVRRVIPVIEDQTLALGPGVETAVFVRGMAPADLRASPFLANSIGKGGSLAGFDQGALVGKGLATKLKLAVGDDLTLVSFGPDFQIGDTIERRRVPVVGIFDVGMSQFDESFVYMPLEMARDVLSKGDRVSVIQLIVDDPDRVGDLMPAIRQAAGPQATANDWRQVNAEFAAVLQQQRSMMRVILLAIIAIAGLNMGSGLVMLVKNKGRDIAILRTMGAGRGAVMRIFLIAGAAVGALAAPVGLGLGLLICAYIKEIQGLLERMTGTKIFDPSVYFLTAVPARVDWSEVAVVMAWTFAVSIFATLPFAWRAGLIEPVEALRYE